MADITASVNEKELGLMHKDFAQHIANLQNERDQEDVDFFDSDQIHCNQEMEVQEGNNKRRLEPDRVEDTQRSKVPCQERNDNESISVVRTQFSQPLSLTQNENSSNRQSTTNVTDQETIIIIRPDQEIAKELINDPIEIVSAVDNSKFGKLNVTDIRTNKRKGLLVAHLKDATSSIVEELLKVQNLGKWKVSCYIPNKDKFKVGVISPINTNSDLEKINTMLSKHHKINSIIRMNKRLNDEWVPSNSLKITFEAHDLPNEVVIGHSLYKVRPYVGQPLQCFRCQRLGHTAEGCKARIRCMVCGGEHVKEVCRAEKDQCANCRGNHKANSKSCNLIKRAYASQDNAKRSMIYGSHSDRNYAMMQYGTQSSQSQGESVQHAQSTRGLNMRTVQAEGHQEMHDPISSTQTYSDRVKSNMHQFSRNQLNGRGNGFNASTTDVGTQTEKSQSKNDISSIVTEHFLDKLKIMLIEILKGCIGKDIAEPEKVVEDAVNSNFSIENEAQLRNNQGAAKGFTYNTRKKNKDVQRSAKGVSNIDVDSLDDGVISSSDEISDGASIYETIEKKQVRINPSKVLTVDDFRKVRKKDKATKDGSKKKGYLKRKS